MPIILVFVLYKLLELSDLDFTYGKSIRCVINGKQTLEADDPGPYLYESICLCFVYDSLSYSMHCNLGLFTLTFPRIQGT
jgi:hypothetical protein